jgi:hypothetical protein
MKFVRIALAAVGLVLAGCGGGGTDHATTGAVTSVSTRGEPTVTTKVEGKLPPGAVGPVDTAEEAAEGPAATEASPESPAAGPQSTGDLSDGDRTAVTAVVTTYIAALDHHDGAAVCGRFEPGALPLGDLPRRRGGCRSSLQASIGVPPGDGGPAWRRTEIVELKPEDLGNDRTRVTATVTHHFSDRKYVSVEEDVIYLQRVGGRWLLAKPSATLYRAVGYAQPPLRAFSPPAGW